MTGSVTHITLKPYHPDENKCTALCGKALLFTGHDEPKGDFWFDSEEYRRIVDPEDNVLVEDKICEDCLATDTAALLELAELL